MLNYDKLSTLIAESGKTKTYLCKKMGRPSYYLRDVLRQKNAIPEDLLTILAAELDTTPAFLRDEQYDTDKKEEPATSKGDGLKSDELELINAFRSAPQSTQEAIRLLLKGK